MKWKESAARDTEAHLKSDRPMLSYSWISHPAKERPLATTLVSAFIVLVLALVYALMKSMLMIVVAIVVLTVALSSFFLPTTYLVDEDRVVIKHVLGVKQRRLSAFRSFYADRRGILLSPFLSPSRLENFRGFYLRYSRDNKDDVDDLITALFEKKGLSDDPKGGN